MKTVRTEHVTYLVAACIVVSVISIPLLSNRFNAKLWQVSSAKCGTLAQCGRCFWEQPISASSGATSGERFYPHKLRTFDRSKLQRVEVLGSGEAPLGPSCPRWLVTTTVNPATRNLRAFAGLADWCKVFVLDRKSPPDFALSGPGVVVLTAAEQEALPWRTARLLPWNHFGRKNLGYLYALTHGAEVIYDTDDDNFIQKSPSGQILLPLSLDPAGDGVPSDQLHLEQLHLAPLTAGGAFNPYPFWGAHDAWPRGFPLSLITNITASTGAIRVPEDAVVTAGQRTCVLQSLANADPDMDGIYRLTRPLPLFFPIQGARLMYPAGMYAPANAQATLLSREVAAALLLPVTVHGRVSDIWRSYILQRVMWDSGCRLAFADPWVMQYRNAHSYLRDFQAELDLYLKVEGMLQVLNGIDLGRELALGPRVMTTFITLYEYGIIEELDVKLSYAYLRDLGLLDPVARLAPLSWSRTPKTFTTASSGSAPGTSLQPLRAPGLSPGLAVVCLTGVFRGGPFTLPLLRRNVLEALGMQFDIVVVTPQEEQQQLQPEQQQGNFKHLLPNLRLVLSPDYGNVTAMALGLNFSLTALKEGTPHTPTGWLKHLTDLSTCNDAIRQTGEQYTHAVRVQADALMMDPLPVPAAEVPEKHVVVPDNEEYQGVNNRFAYGRIQDMAILFDQLHAVADLLPRAPAVAEDWRMWNAEQMYAVHAADNGITFDKRPIQMCRFTGLQDGVLWMDGHDASTYTVCSGYCAKLRSCKHS